MKNSDNRKEYALNAVFLKNQLLELGLKQWWLAEQLGVDRKTVSRWVNGKVKSVQKENAEALCQVLDCKLEEITTQSVADQLATAEEQKAAAKLLASSSLVEKLGPIGEWDVIESLLKATIVPDLPLQVLGELYDMLTIAAWRQSKVDDADVYNHKALEVGEKSGDKNLYGCALISQANIYSWRGYTESAIETYKKCLEYEDYIDAKALGSIYSNLGATYYEAGDLQAGKENQLLAIKQFGKLGKSMNFSIAYGHISMIELQLGNIDEAEKNNSLAMKFAEEDNFLRSIAMCTLVQAEIHAHRGEREKAIELKEQAFKAFADLSIAEGLNYEYAGRIYRLLGEFDLAREHLEKGIELSKEFPVYQAAIYLEMLVLLKQFDKSEDEIHEVSQKAIELYQRCQCPLRVEQVKSLIGLH